MFIFTTIFSESKILREYVILDENVDNFFNYMLFFISRVNHENIPKLVTKNKI